MKLLPLAVLGLAGVALAVVALRAPSRDYVAPSAADIEAHRPAPQELRNDVPAGCAVRTIHIEGMCCLGCTGRIYEKIVKTPGVVDAAVSFEKGIAQIVIPESADPAPFAAALRFDKYRPELEP